MNDQMIYQLMAKTPNIRAVQIADALDKDLSDVSEALRSLVEVGDVVAHTGTAPNGQPTRLYNLSDEFKRSKDGRALLASVVGAMLAEPVAPTLPPAPPFPEPAAAVVTPVFATQTEMAPNLRRCATTAARTRTSRLRSSRQPRSRIRHRSHHHPPPPKRPKPCRNPNRKIRRTRASTTRHFGTSAANVG